MPNIIIDSQKKHTEIPDLEEFYMHTHNFYEIFCFLSGNAQYFVEGNIYSLKPGDILIMKKSEAHSLLIKTKAPYERIVLNFNEKAILSNRAEEIIAFLNQKPLGKKNRYPFAIFKDKNWLYYLEMICNSKSVDEQSIYLTVLLNELYENFSKIDSGEKINDNMTDVIKYINQHLNEDLTLDNLCNRFFLSKTHLNRKFKQITGSTAWEYILAKRLILAKELLQGGVKPTSVFSRCGFNDYSSFFKAYKRKFSINPKEDYIPNN